MYDYPLEKSWRGWNHTVGRCLLGHRGYYIYTVYTVIEQASEAIAISSHSVNDISTSMISHSFTQCLRVRGELLRFTACGIRSRTHNPLLDRLLENSGKNRPSCEPLLYVQQTRYR